MHSHGELEQMFDPALVGARRLSDDELEARLKAARQQQGRAADRRIEEFRS